MTRKSESFPFIEPVNNSIILCLSKLSVYNSVLSVTANNNQFNVANAKSHCDTCTILVNYHFI